MSQCHNVSQYQFSYFHLKTGGVRCEVWVAGAALAWAGFSSAYLSFWAEISNCLLCRLERLASPCPLQSKHPQQAGNFWSNLESFVDNLMMEKLLMESSFSKHRNPVRHKELYSPAWMRWKIYKNKSSSEPRPSRHISWTGKEARTIYPISALVWGENR